MNNLYFSVLCREKAREWGVVVGGGEGDGFLFKTAITCRRSFAPSPLLRPEGKTRPVRCKMRFLIGKEVKKMVEVEDKSLQSATEVCRNQSQVRRALLEIWDTVIDLQDQIATAVALANHPDPGLTAETAWVVRPGMAPEKVNLVEYAKEVLSIE